MRTEERAKRFKRVYVEITNACNLTCAICPGTKRKSAFMTPDSFKLVLGEIKPFTDYLYLHVMGEPLLHPEFPKIMEICEMLGFKVNIATNGVLIKRHADALLKSKALRQVNFSIHCLEIQRSSSIPENYLQDILGFIDEGRKRSAANFALRIWNLRKGGKAESALLRQIAEFFQLPSNLESELTPGNGITLAPRVYLNLAEEFKWPDMNTVSGEGHGRGFCRGLRDHCAILVEGTVVPCCLDRDGLISLGNVFESEFESIIGSEKALKIIDGFSEGKAVEPLCKSCEFRKRFDS